MGGVREGESMCVRKREKENSEEERERMCVFGRDRESQEEGYQWKVRSELDWCDEGTNKVEFEGEGA